MLDVLVDMTALNTPSRERGIGRYVKGLCRALAARAKDELSIVGLTRHHGSLDGALDLTLQFSGDPSIAVSDWQYQRHKLERRLFLGGLAQKSGARLLHLPDPPGTPMDRRLPRVVTCHDLIPLVLAHDYLAPLPGARALQRARDTARYCSALRVIAISESTKRDLVKYLGLAEDRVDVVYSGVDHERFSAIAADGESERVRARLGFANPFLLCLGASDARKNLPLLVRAFAQSGVAEDVKLVFAGPISPRKRARLELAIGESGVRDSVHILGYIEDALLVALFRHCLAYVFPSSYEGFGLPILEAMASGAPTLTSTLSALGEIAGDAALTIPTIDEETLAGGIQRIVADAALRASLRELGLLHAKTFTWQRCAEQTVACYRRALDEVVP
ncbi:MAG TPA: glycosyltransferase family 1 protein [Polyangiaceae bacterium]|jgi:glycosyltransferase involved in cell wall biosynthesis|nr:glycosyltransferase family 1 protein [Polyangiaceae bacterium]